MRPSPETPGSDLLWMDPVARDMVAMCYGQIKRPSAALTAVTSCHGILWREALTGPHNADHLRRELSLLASFAGISESAIEWVNRQVMAELLETIAKRFTRSPREAGRLSFEVARAACRIAQARPLQENGNAPARIVTELNEGAAA